MLVKKITIIVLVLTAVVLKTNAPAYADWESTKEFLYEYGTNYYNQRNYKEALVEFNKILLLDPGNKKASVMIEKIKAEQEELLKSELAARNRLSDIECVPGTLRIEETKEDLAREELIRSALDDIQDKIEVGQMPLPHEISLPVETRGETSKEITEFTEIEEEKIPIYKAETEYEIQKPVAEKLEEPAAERLASTSPAGEKKLVIKDAPIGVTGKADEQVLAMPKTEDKLAMAPKPMPKEEKPTERWLSSIGKKGATTSSQLQDYNLFNPKEFIIDGESLQITPVILRGDDIWLPIEQIAKHLNLAMFKIGDNTFILNRDDGTPLELTIGDTEILVSKVKFLELTYPVLEYQAEAMVNVRDLERLLDKDVSWDVTSEQITIKSRFAPVEFTTFTQARPVPLAEESAKEEEPIAIEKPEIALGRLVSKSADIRPDINLRFTNYLSYLYNNLNEESNKKTYSLGVSGYAYDYRVDGDFRWEENIYTGSMENAEKFIGFYGKDKYFEFLDLSESIPLLRSQSEGYEGFRFTKLYNPFTSKFFIGQRDITVTRADSGESIKYDGSLFGLRQDYDSEKIDANFMLLGLQAQAQADSQQGTTSLPRRNFIWSAGSTWHLTDYFDLLGQYAFCNYNPDNLKNELIRDHDWLLGSALNTEKFRLGYRYEFVGKDYDSFGNPDNYQDYKGWELTSGYTLTDKISFYGSLNASQDNVDEDINQITNKSKSFGLGTSILLPKDITTSFDYGQDKSENTEGTGSKTDNFRFGIFKNWLDVSFYFNYYHYIIDIFNSDDDSTRDTYSASIYKFLPALRGSYLRLQQSFSRTEPKLTSSPVTNAYATSFGFKYYFLRNLFSYGSCRLNVNQSDGTATAYPMYFDINTQWDITRDTGFGIDYTFGPYYLKNENKQNWDTWSVLFRVMKSFEVSSPEKWGRIKGRVFVDANGNGVYDKEDVGLRGILVEVPRQNAVKTDASGRYVMKEVIPGEKTVSVNSLDFPIELTSKDKFVRTVTLSERETEEVDFSLVESGRIEGRLFIDGNNNGKFDLGEEGVEDVQIILSPRDLSDVTDENGKFLFEYLYPEPVTLKININDLPVDFKLISSTEQSTLVESGKVSEVEFGGVVKQVEVQSF